jgi:hypothetical protein
MIFRLSHFMKTSHFTHVNTLQHIIKVMILAMLLILPTISFANARGSDLYQINNIRTDVTTDNAVKAQQEALAKARSEAFNILKERLTQVGEDGSAIAKKEAADDLTISSLIKTLEINDEQLSSTRYAATVSVTFDAKAVKSFFYQQGERHTTSSRAPFLILPWFITAGQARIWQDYNPWRTAWAGLAQMEPPLAPFILPMGDLSDIQSYAPSSLFAYQEDGINSLTKRYGVTNAFLAMAEPRGSTIQFSLYRTDSGTPVQITTQTVAIQQSLNPYRLGAEKLLAFLNSDWKDKTAISPNQNSNQYPFSARFSGLQEWISIRDNLKDIPDIDDIKIKSVSPKGAELTILYKGTIEGLSMMLDQYGIGLIENGTPQMQAQMPNFGYNGNRLDAYGRPIQAVNAQAHAPQMSYELFLKPHRY